MWIAICTDRVQREVDNYGVFDTREEAVRFVEKEWFLRTPSEEGVNLVLTWHEENSTDPEGSDLVGVDDNCDVPVVFSIVKIRVKGS